jgi:alkane 1-monooxygenase
VLVFFGSRMSCPSAIIASGSSDNAAGHALRDGVAPLLCFILPVSTLCFLLTGPHGWQAALGWTLPVWLCVAADYISPADRSAPRAGRLDWLLDARLYALFGLQWANIVLLLDLAGHLRWGTVAEFAASAANVLAARVLVGSTSCCCGIAVAHELLHRSPRHLRWMGRMLLWTVCYDHFAVAHGRGHHRLAATPADPATARFGERFGEFFRRSLRGQWLTAWRLEDRRLRQCSGSTRWLRHRVLQGVAVQLAGLALVWACFGPLALLLFLYQAWVAVRLLEAVNYVQHWGLVRTGARCGGADAWSCDSWFTLHSFIGLSRHADHHACAGKPCHRLAYREESPRLPGGYFVMALFVRLRNDRFCELAGRELRARGLGPFRAAACGMEPTCFLPGGIVFADGSVKVSGADGWARKAPSVFPSVSGEIIDDTT